MREPSSSQRWRRCRRRPEAARDFETRIFGNCLDATPPSRVLIDRQPCCRRSHIPGRSLARKRRHAPARACAQRPGAEGGVRFMLGAHVRVETRAAARTHTGDGRFACDGPSMETPGPCPPGCWDQRPPPSQPRPRGPQPFCARRGLAARVNGPGSSTTSSSPPILGEFDPIAKGEMPDDATLHLPKTAAQGSPAEVERFVIMNAAPTTDLAPGAAPTARERGMSPTNPLNTRPVRG